MKNSINTNMPLKFMGKKKKLAYQVRSTVFLGFQLQEPSSLCTGMCQYLLTLNSGYPLNHHQIWDQN